MSEGEAKQFIASQRDMRVCNAFAEHVLAYLTGPFISTFSCGIV